jgi:hypothetical protein
VKDRPHPILPNAVRYGITKISWSAETDDADAFIDVTFVRDADIHTLRFFNPSEIRISMPGKQPATGEFEILDVSARGLDGLNVLVQESGASGAPVAFWARSVEKLPGNQ